MREIVIQNIKARFSVLTELAESLTPSQYSAQLDIPKSKSIEDHFWCIVGARESYLTAILSGQWQGFSCSLSDASLKPDYVNALLKTAEDFESVIGSAQWSSSTEQLLASLHEHEVMHEGQLIRLVYALKLKMPSSSKWA